MSLISIVNKAGEKIYPKLPFLPQKLVSETLLNRVMAEPLADGDLDPMLDKTVRVKLTGTPVKVCIQLKNNKLLVLPDREIADVTISAKPYDLMLLISRSEDPDALFFQRRLQITGDTELGLHIKNTLDTLDMTQLPAPLLKALELFKADYQKRIERLAVIEEKA